MRRPKIVIAGVALAVLASIGGVTAAAAGTSTPAGAPVAGHTATAATVRTATVAVGGKSETILTTATGQPLYYYQPDTAARSLVTGGLARLWPPLTSAAPTGTGTSGKLAVLSDVNGQQVTYNGHPLYTFIDDRAGQGVQDFFVATPGLPAITASPAPGAAVPSAPGNGYGY